MENPRPPARSYGVSRDHASFCFWGGGDGLGDLGGAVGAAEFDGLGAAGFGGLGQAGGGGGEPAGGAVLAGVADGVQVGFVGQAAVHHVGAAGVEGAAGRQPDQAGRLAGDRAEPLGGGRGAGDGLEQALGVGVVGLVEDVALGGLLGRAAGVHDHDVVGDVGDDAEVVGDHQQGGVGVLLQPQQQVQDLGLDGGVQRGGGLVGDDQLGAERDRHRDHGALAHAD